jgi:FkbM family methyltransferase
MNIYYGISTNFIDVTEICLSKLTNNNIITIPAGDGNRANYFTDPLFGIHKKIIISLNNNLSEYDEYVSLKININNNTITTINENDINNKLKNIHSRLKIKYGNLNEELPEQKMVVRYLTGNEKILEIGGNIGRNSLVIASILRPTKVGTETDEQRLSVSHSTLVGVDSHSAVKPLLKHNFVTLESDINIAKQLEENRDLNNFDFNIESSALSNRKLIQRGWDTIPCDTLQSGYNWVNTITLSELKNKYNIEFDTLVLDCEGAFYYILMDMPEILNNINLIIMENDYWDINKKEYIDDILTKNNFYVDYVESGGWGPCRNNFFEVWKKN